MALLADTKETTTELLVPNSETGEDEKWKVPMWQRPVDPTALALHPDGPLCDLKKEGYLQKRAGTSRYRWNIRYFELIEGQLRWWRPDFKEQIKQPLIPKALVCDQRPRPVRSLDLSKLRAITRTRVKFPYSTRILLRFDEAYTKYQLELRAERENIMLEWFRNLVRFTLETYEVNVEKEAELAEDSTLEPSGTGHSEEEEEGFEDVRGANLEVKPIAEKTVEDSV
mmetsp:Transcript_15877/g.25242  ORF Transcript_15877/g.25242 Transcript_15877/m.25242 type:complete len:226 (-) Transcript_15877:24-701(-)